MARTAKKAQFVKRHLHKRPADIIAAGAAAGISLSQSYVAKLRSSSPKTFKRVRLNPSARESAAAEFSKLVWQVGTLRVREWLAALDEAPISEPS